MDLNELELPVTNFMYKRVHNYGIYTYRLFDVFYSKTSFQYSSSLLLKMKMENKESYQSNVKLFNEIYVPIINSKCLNLYFREDDGSVYRCSPAILDFCQDNLTSKQQYKFDSAFVSKDVLASTLARVQGRRLGSNSSFQFHESLNLQSINPFIASSDMAFSVHSIVHEFIETRSKNLIHTGISLVPCSSLYIPIWIADIAMVELLEIWNEHKIPQALKKSFSCFVYLNGSKCIHKTSYL